MSTGWVRLYRSLLDSSVYNSEPFCRNMAWIDLLLIAQYKDSFIRVRGIKVEVKRGQCAYSVDTLAKRWRWGRGKVMRYLKELENEQQIGLQKDNVITLITIVNYDKYQSNDATDDTANDTPNEPQTVQQTYNKRTHTKKVNNEENINKEKNTPPLSPAGDLSEPLRQFEEFRLKYPGNKRGLETEFKTFCKHRDWRERLPELLPALDKQIQDKDKRAEVKAFVPQWQNLCTWLNKRSWEEQLQAIQPIPTPGERKAKEQQQYFETLNQRELAR